ncbi:MAG: ATP-binding protein [Cyanobacteria bacterium P01_G01_bin.54]
MIRAFPAAANRVAPPPEPSQRPAHPAESANDAASPSSLDPTAAAPAAAPAILESSLAESPSAPEDRPEPESPPLLEPPSARANETLTPAATASVGDSELEEASPVSLATAATDATVGTDAKTPAVKTVAIAAETALPETVSDTVWGADDWSELAQANLAQMELPAVDSPDRGTLSNDWDDPFAHDPYAEDPFANLAALALPIAAIPISAPHPPSVHAQVPISAPHPPSVHAQVPNSASETTAISPPDPALSTHERPPTLNPEPAPAEAKRVTSPPPEPLPPESALPESTLPQPAPPECLPPEFASPSPGRPEQHEQYVQFITEVQALWQTLAQQLLVLTPSANPAALERLMQTSEQLKGAAAAVGQETIKTIAHNLEDVFRALLAPEATLDDEIKALLDRDVELLRLALRREWVQDHSQDVELLQAATVVFGQLQAKLAAEPTAPTAADELDFDLAQAIFATGVEARLKDFAALLARHPTAEAVQTYWHNQVDVFCRVADTLHLSGFKTVVEAGAAAIAAHPDQVLTIAPLLLANLRAAQAQVLAGDCRIGGSVSPELAAWLSPPPAPQSDSSPHEASDPSNAPPLESPHDSPHDALDELLLTPEPPLAVTPIPEPMPQASDPATATTESSSIKPPATELAELATMPPPELATTCLPIELAQLAQLNHCVGALRIKQHQMALRDRQLQGLLQQLDADLQQQRQTLTQLQAALQPHQPVTPTVPQPDPSLLTTAIAQTQRLRQAREDLDLLVRNSHDSREQEQQLTQQLQGHLDATRLVPLGAMLKRFPPMVKQLALIHQKPVELQLQGTAVCIDKAIVENLYDALLHLLRNVFDHGIEPAEQRRQADKPEQGTITIAAMQQGNRTLIQVQDDGQGLLIARICERAVHQGLLTAPAAQALLKQPRPEADLLALLCTPGFSTATEVNTFSGQGLGLARVKAQLTQIKGQLQMRSQPGQGCCFTLQMRTPLLNARLLICQAGQARYGLVTHEIEQVLIPGAPLRWQAGQKVLDSNPADPASTMPIYALTDLLPLPSRWTPFPAEDNSGPVPLTPNELAPGKLAPLLTPPILTPPTDAQPVLLLRTPEGRVGLEVTQILDEQELGIKPLGGAIAPPPYIYGCTVLADGQLALVLDGILLVQQAQQQGIRRIGNEIAELAAVGPNLDTVGEI